MSNEKHSPQDSTYDQLVAWYEAGIGEVGEQTHVVISEAAADSGYFNRVEGEGRITLISNDLFLESFERVLVQRGLRAEDGGDVLQSLYEGNPETFRLVFNCTPQEAIAAYVASRRFTGSQWEATEAELLQGAVAREVYKQCMWLRPDPWARFDNVIEIEGDDGCECCGGSDEDDDE